MLKYVEPTLLVSHKVWAGEISPNIPIRSYNPPHGDWIAPNQLDAMNF